MDSQPILTRDETTYFVWFLKRLLAIFLLVLAITTVVVAYAVAWRIPDMQSAKNWPTVEGRIIRTRTYSCGKAAADVRPDTKYEYEVNHIKYSGDSIAFNLYGCMSNEEAGKLISEYPLGPVRVWYKPDDPSVSVIKTGPIPSRVIYWLVGAGIAFVVFVIGAWFSLRWSRKIPKRS